MDSSPTFPRLPIRVVDRVDEKTQEFFYHRFSQPLVDLSSLNPYFPAAPYIEEEMAAAAKAIGSPSGYPTEGVPGERQRFYSSRDDSGTKELSEAATTYYAHHGVTPSHPGMCVGNSAVGDLVHNVCEKFLGDGEKALGAAPIFGIYVTEVLKSKASMVLMKTSADNDWKLTPKRLRQLLDSREADGARVFFFLNPVNPTGAVYTRQELTELAKVFVEHNEKRRAQGMDELLVVCDEVGQNLMWDHKSDEFAHLAGIAWNAGLHRYHLFHVQGAGPRNCGRPGLR